MGIEVEDAGDSGFTTGEEFTDGKPHTKRVGGQGGDIASVTIRGRGVGFGGAVTTMPLAKGVSDTLPVGLKEIRAGEPLVVGNLRLRGF